jgi:RHS repeat-associated protein
MSQSRICDLACWAVLRFDEATILTAVSPSRGIRQGRQSQGFTYNASERLIETADANGNAIAQYAYDPFGRRIKKIVRQALTADSATGTTLYFYSDEGLIAESDESGNISTTYGWHPQRSVSTDPVFKRDHQGSNTTEHYYHNDHAGTPQKLTNAAGEITWAAYSEAFGRTTVDNGVTPQATAATTNNLRFAGQYDDSETGLHHNVLRDYDPTTGRYLQTDPIGLAGGLNTYAYVEGDPVNLIDPTGENPAALLYVYARCVAQCTAQSAAGDFLDNKCPEFGDYAKDCALSCANPLNWLGGRGGPGRVGARGPGRGAGPAPVRGPQQRIEALDPGKNLSNNKRPGPGEDLYVGPYGKSSYGNKTTGLNETHTPHHVVQDAVSDLSRSKGPTINLRKDLHDLTRTKNRNADLGDNVKNLAADIKDLRNILRDAGYDRSLVNQQMRELITQNRRAGIVR